MKANKADVQIKQTSYIKNIKSILNYPVNLTQHGCHKPTNKKHTDTKVTENKPFIREGMVMAVITVFIKTVNIQSYCSKIHSPKSH